MLDMEDDFLSLDQSLGSFCTLFKIKSGASMSDSFHSLYWC